MPQAAVTNAANAIPFGGFSYKEGDSGLTSPLAEEAVNLFNSSDRRFHRPNPEQKALMDKFVQQEREFRRLLSSKMTGVNNVADFGKTANAFTQQYTEFLKTTVALSELLAKSHDSKRLQAAGAVGRLAQQLALDRDFMTVMTENVLDENQNSADTNLNGTVGSALKNQNLFQALKGTTIVAVREDEKEMLGKGGVNTVYSAADQFGTRVVEKPGRHSFVVKDIMQKDDDNLKNMYTAFGYDTTGGTADHSIDVDDARRDQGARIIANLLKFNVIVPTKLGFDTQSGPASIMSRVDGKNADTCAYYVGGEDERQRMAYKAGDGVEVINLGSERRLIDDLAKMAVNDILAGNEDRHGGNIIIYTDEDGNKRAMGIDNDSAFGLQGVNAEFNKRFGSYSRTMEASLPIVSREIQTAVNNINEEDYKNYLNVAFANHPQGKERVDAALGRLRELKQYINTTAQIVDDYNGDISPLLAKPLSLKDVNCSPFTMLIDRSEQLKPGVQGWAPPQQETAAPKSPVTEPSVAATAEHTVAAEAQPTVAAATTEHAAEADSALHQSAEVTGQGRVKSLIDKFQRAGQAQTAVPPKPMREKMTAKDLAQSDKKPATAAAHRAETAAHTPEHKGGKTM